MNPDNPLNLPTELPIARYRFSFTLQDDLSLPFYAGSTLRGVFGHALRRAACMTRQKECGGCPLLETCPYTRIFAAPKTEKLNRSQQHTPPQAYIIEAPHNGTGNYPAGTDYTFDIVLIGTIRDQLPLISYAFSQAFQQGIGRTQARGRLKHISIETPSGWQHILDDGKIQAHPNTLILPPSYPHTLTLQHQTPMRLHRKKQLLRPNNITAADLMRQVLRRTAALSALYFPVQDQADFAALSAQAAAITADSRLHWQDLRRYSNRQQQLIPLGGITGSWHFPQLPPAYAQALYLSQWLHIGKETAFGLGKTRLIAA